MATINARAILIHQTHDAAGRPAVADYAQPFPLGLVNSLTMQPVYKFLRTMDIRLTAVADEYAYADPATGRGTLRVAGFAYGDRKGIAEYALLREVDAAIGMPEPLRWDGRQSGFGQPRPFKNPWIMCSLAAVLALGGILVVGYSLVNGLVDPTRVAAAITGAFFGLLFTVLGAVLLVQHVPRIRWWTRARAYLRSTGRALPSDLDTFN